jgi:hypothetical protein
MKNENRTGSVLLATRQPWLAGRFPTSGGDMNEKQGFDAALVELGLDRDQLAHAYQQGRDDLAKALAEAEKKFADEGEEDETALLYVDEPSTYEGDLDYDRSEDAIRNLRARGYEDAYFEHKKVSE